MLRIELVLLFGSLCATHAALAPASAPADGRTRAFAPAPGPAASKPFTTAQKQAPPATPTLPCTSTQTALGGYSPVTDQEADSLSQDVAPAAWQAFTNKNGLTKCATSTVNTLSYNVTEACKQVVAGTNIALQFYAYYDCTTASNAPSFGSVGLNAIVFEPLPTQGTNSKFQVRKVWNITEA